jgi:hypothetical protein
MWALDRLNEELCPQFQGVKIIIVLRLSSIIFGSFFSPGYESILESRKYLVLQPLTLRFPIIQ